MPKTIQVRDDVFATGSVACDFKELREFYRDNVEALTACFDECKKIFEIDDVSLLFNNIRKTATVGMYKLNEKQICLDLRSYDLTAIVGTIIHEMCHAKQHAEGRLTFGEGKGVAYKFDGEDFAKPKNHDEYLALPWEIEARAATDKYLKRVMKKIK